jgi:phosphoribosylglycinamide formyltransferase 1
MIGVLVGSRGRGSNMRALVEASLQGSLDASVSVVVADSPNSPALALARELNVRTAVVTDELPMHEAFADVDWICLAGYMRLLPDAILESKPGRILNIHPSLLPKFGGVGMYGMHVHRAVLKAGESESGCTVHRVSPIYDAGEIILQRRCPVLPDDTAESLAARVLALEHLAYPEAVQKEIGRAQ